MTKFDTTFILELVKKFEIKKPIEFVYDEDLPRINFKNGSILLSYNNKSKIDQYIELIGKAKLAELYNDPLHAVIFCQKDCTPEEKNFMDYFYYLCYPLQSAWAYQIVKKYAIDLYKKKIESDIKMFNILIMLAKNYKKYHGKIPKDQILFQFNIYAIIKADSEIKDQIKLFYQDKKEKYIWKKYIKALDNYVHQKPNSMLYKKLVESLNPPYTIKLIKNINYFDYFEIRSK